MFGRKSKIIKEQAEEIKNLKRINEQHNLINRWNIDTNQHNKKKIKQMEKLLKLYQMAMDKEK